ncbi:hypothetical protein MMC22_006858 [Lobaria immixta]|nr:hypothetical protein [Lobaria immixta]
MPRADLATPHGIDQDFNFLTSIERKLDAAERDTTQRGVVPEDDDERGRHGPMKGEVRLKEALEQCGVIVRKAPAGMARAKQNKTCWHPRKKRVVWTVEWIHNGGRSEIGSCPASLPICEAYTAQSAPCTQMKKRKRDSEPSPPPSSTASHRPPRPLSLLSATTSSSSSSSPTAKPSLYFYLLRPCTPPSLRVLIPFPSSMATLATSLRDRLLLEFPTIYALKYPPDKLPTGFITEAEYLAQPRASSQREGVVWFGADREEDEEVWRSGGIEHADGDGGGRTETEEGKGEETVDANRLLAVLARDLGA